MNNIRSFNLYRLDILPSSKHYFIARIFEDWYFNNLSIDEIALKYDFSSRQVERFIFNLTYYISL